MLEINREVVTGIIENLEYLNVIYDVNPKVKVPLKYISPILSAKTFNNPVHVWNHECYYRFICSSLTDVSDTRINKGSDIYSIINEHDDNYLDLLYNRYLFEENLDEEDEDIDSINFLKYLENEEIYCFKFKLSFITKYSYALDDLIRMLSDKLVIDYIERNGKQVFGYGIDIDTCIISLWYIIDQDSMEYDPFLEDRRIETLFLKTLENEAV